MSSPQTTVTEPGASRHPWLCLLLPLLFLCDPFFTVIASSNVLSVHHPPSYRATIASPELLKFSAPEKLNVPGTRGSTIPIDCDVLDSVSSLAPQRQFSPHFTRTDERVHIDPVVIGNLWFRPPPVL
jgi:hypothetical protein